MRILIIEDEKRIANFIKQGLEEESYAVDVSNDGEDGLEKALVNEYDLILLDWNLPERTGLEICRQLRKNEIITPIIFLTAKDAVEDVIKGLDSGANDYIKKPFAFNELAARIKVQLRESSSVSNELMIDDLVINTDTHRVFRKGTEIALTQKEFALLEFMMRNKGKVCTRTRIIEHVWDINFESDTSVIDVYVNFLRKKLDEGGSKKLIHTIRGVGYIIKED